MSDDVDFFRLDKRKRLKERKNSIERERNKTQDEDREACIAGAGRALEY